MQEERPVRRQLQMSKQAMFTFNNSTNGTQAEEKFNDPQNGQGNE